MGILDEIRSSFPETIPSTEEILKYASSSIQPSLKHGVSALASGSRIEGVFNELSDLDLFLVADQSDTVAQGVADITSEDGYYIDTEFYTLPSLQSIVDKVLAAKDSPIKLCLLSVSEIDVIYRLSIGKSIVQTDTYEQFVEEVLKKIPIAQIFGQYCAAHAQINLEQARSVRNHKVPSLIYQHCAAQWAMDGILAANGESFPSRKWRHEKAMRLGIDSQETSDWWSLESSPSASRIDDIGALVSRAKEETSATEHDIAELLCLAATPELRGISDNMDLLLSADNRCHRLDHSDIVMLREGNSGLLSQISALGFTRIPFHFDGSPGFATPRYHDSSLANVLSSRSAIDMAAVSGRSLQISGMLAAIEFDIVGALRSGQRGLAYLATVGLLDLCVEHLLMDTMGLVYNFRDRAELYWACEQQVEHDRIGIEDWSVILDIVCCNDPVSEVESICSLVLDFANKLGIKSASAMNNSEGNIYRSLVREHFQLCAAIGCRTSLHEFFDA